MKILSWNIERPIINDKRKTEIIELISSFNADLIFLTETNSDINFSNYYSLKTENLPLHYNGIQFNTGENKASIYSKYPIVEEIITYDKFSSVCCEIETEFGELVLYSSIIGFLGGKDKYFKFDLKKQKEDLSKLCLNYNVCFSGDLNISFSGFPYPSKNVVSEMESFFKLNNLMLTTASNSDCAIHIVISNTFLENRKVSTKMIEIKRKLSDHNLVITEIL